MQIEKTVFISYRRTNIPWALSIYQHLTYHNYDVFFDYTSIASGDFEQIIIENIKARAHFIVVLTPSALERCSDPGDWLRREIETAVDTRRNIVPILLEGFDFGAPESAKYLTGKLENLQHYNGLRLHADYFEEGMARLCERYLNVPLEAVIHPLSQPVEREVNRQQQAAAQKPKVTQTELTAQEWFERGYKAAEPEEQIRCYTETIQRDPMYADAYNNRGVCYQELGQLEHASADFEKAIQINPDYAEAYSNRGLSYANLGQHERAIADLDRAIRINPEYAEAYANRGSSYCDLSQYERGIADFDKAIQINPELAEAYANRGYSYDALGQHERAITDYDKAIQINPEYAPAYYNKACSYGLQGNAEEAVIWLREALIGGRDLFCEMVQTDGDFDLIRGEDAFKALMDEFGC